MAYAQQFISLRGTTYTLNIDGVTLPTGAVVPPLGATPFETEEESDTDMFMPVRTQSGYIRMTAFDLTTWQSFIPNGVTAEPVTLTAGNTVVWQGYVQTGTYGMTYPAKYEEIELPVICPLSALDAFDMDTTGPSDMVTIGQLLNNIFSKLTGLSFTFYFHIGSSTTMIQTWLELKVSWRNFLQEEGGTLESRYSCLGVLQELCKFFGWTCRIDGANVFFTSITDANRNSKFAYCSLSGLANSSRTWSTVNMDSATIGDVFADTDQSEEFIPGIKKVTVNSELNPFDILLEIPTDKFISLNKYNTIFQRERWIDTKEQGPYDMCYRGGQGAFSYENDNVKIDAYAEKVSDYNTESQCYGRMCIYDPNNQDDQVKLRYSWTCVFECFRSNDYGPRQNDTPMFIIQSKHAYTLTNGVLYINGRTDNKIRGYAVCTLRIGNSSSDYQYWNGTSWTSTESVFSLQCDNQGIADTRSSVNEAEYDGTGIVISSPMSGKIYFAIHDVIPQILYNGYFPLMDFKIGFVRNNQDSEANDVNYTANGGQFTDEVDVDTIFTSEKTIDAGSSYIYCQSGYGQVQNASGPIVTIPFGQEYFKPEQRVANLIAAYGTSVKRVLTLNVQTDQIGNIGPRHTVTVGSQSFSPVSVGHSWRDDVTTLKLMQL